MVVCLAFSRAPLTGPNRCDSPKGGPGVHRLSNPTELLDRRCRKPNPVRGGNIASSGTGRVRKSTANRDDAGVAIQGAAESTAGSSRAITGLPALARFAPRPLFLDLADQVSTHLREGMIKVALVGGCHEVRPSR